MYEITLIEKNNGKTTLVKEYRVEDLPIKDDRILLDNNRAFKVEERILSISSNSVVLTGVTFSADILGIKQIN